MQVSSRSPLETRVGQLFIQQTLGSRNRNRESKKEWTGSNFEEKREKGLSKLCTEKDEPQPATYTWPEDPPNGFEEKLPFRGFYTHYSLLSTFAKC